jgi:asparagine synthase (glutamine-hydrolysing)
MCGINGIFNYGKSNAIAGKDLIQKMNNTIRHRGPDDEGVEEPATDVLFFGHCRLSIIDLSKGGHQPMTSESGNVIIFNGEIYNYLELKGHFPGRIFKSSSDTEILLAMYEKYGEACLDYLNGMFAFAIWDKQKEELFMARDRSGKKPLYFSQQQGIFAFSSEIKALLELPWIKPQLDEEAFYHFLTFNMLPPPLTMFKNIFKFHPAHKMKLDKHGSMSYSAYWEVEYSDFSNQTFDELKDKTLQGLEKSVAYRMISNVPVGAFLSGGVDSSALVAIMSKLTTHPIKTYSIGFENQPDYDELIFARKVSKMFNTDHYERTVKPDDLRNFLPKVVDIFDEPIADSTCIPIYFISEKAREKGSIVVLTGDGSDEIFAGYRNYLRYLKYYRYFSGYSKFPAFIKSTISRTYALYDNSSPRNEMLFRAWKNQEFFWGGARSFKESVKADFLTKEFQQRNAKLNSYSIISDYKKQFNKTTLQSKHNIDWMCYLGFKFTDPNRYLYRADKLGMAHSIELRSPFLDYEYVNFALSLPGKYKIVNNEPKYILKKALEKILPADILYRKKMGFCLPLREWGGDVMIDFVTMNANDFCKNTDLFNLAGIEKIVSKVRSGNDANINDLWTIYFLMSWFKKWMNA